MVKPSYNAGCCALAVVSDSNEHRWTLVECGKSCNRTEVRPPANGRPRPYSREELGYDLGNSMLPVFVFSASLMLRESLVKALLLPLSHVTSPEEQEGTGRHGLCATAEVERPCRHFCMLEVCRDAGLTPKQSLRSGSPTFNNRPSLANIHKMDHKPALEGARRHGKLHQRQPGERRGLKRWDQD